MDGAADAAWVITSGQLITVAPSAGQMRRTPLPEGAIAWTCASAIRTSVVKSHTAVPEIVVCGSGCGGGGPPPASTTVSTARQYDAFDNLSELSATSFGTLVYQDAITRDADGRITQAVEDQNGVTTTWGYTYDTRGRLASVSENGSVVGTYGYDGNGNRISVNGQTVATYNADDQLTSYNGVPYTYAADGSLASAGSTTYQYDALGHLLEVKTPSETITYTYDGLGRRVGKSINGTLVQGFLYADGLHPIAELDGQGNVVATFVYGTRPNVPDLMLKGGVTYRIVSDPLGSPVEVVDTATGAIVEQIGYDAWGNITSDTNPGFQPFGFAGGLYDADTGLVHFGARDYDPGIGRWTTRDPLGFAGGDTNLYGYVLQDPVNGIDPRGLWSLTISAFDGLGGFFSFGQDPKTHQWFYGGGLGVGLGGGVSFNYKGARPGFDGKDCFHGTSVGTFGSVSASAGPYQWNLDHFSAGTNFGGKSVTHYHNPPTYGGFTFGNGAGFSVGGAVGFDVYGH